MSIHILLEQPPIVLRSVRDEPLLKNSLLPTGIEAKISHENVQVLIHATNPCQNLEPVVYNDLRGDGWPAYRNIVINEI